MPVVVVVLESVSTADAEIKRKEEAVGNGEAPFEMTLNNSVGIGG